MAYSPSGVITGTAQTGFTSPTYTVAAAQAPTQLGKQVYVSAVGGTQPNVVAHSGSRRFLANFVVPASWKSQREGNTSGSVGAGTGAMIMTGFNTFNLLVLKGCKVDSIGNIRDMRIRVTIDLPVGADAFDAESVRAAQSFAYGLLSNQSAGIGDTTITGAA